MTINITATIINTKMHELTEYLPSKIKKEREQSYRESLPFHNKGFWKANTIHVGHKTQKATMFDLMK